MTSHTGELNSKKYILAWPFRVPAVIRALFTLVFLDAFHLIEYMRRYMTETDGYYLIIHQDILDHLSIDQINTNAQIIRIDVICDNEFEQARAQRCFSSKCNKIQFWMLHNLSELYDQFLDEQELSYSNFMYDQIQAGIRVIVQTWCPLKQLYICSQRSQIAQRLPSTVLHGYSVGNFNEFDSSHICPSCRLIYSSHDQLRCRHNRCRVCIKVQQSCIQCPQDLAVNQMRTTTTTANFQSDIQDRQTKCVYCNQVLSLREYELHLRTNHLCSLVHFISDNQVVGNVMPMSMNGTCIWEIRNFQRQRAICNDSPQGSIYSPPFYLSPNGYRMCLRLYMNGNGSGKGTHMSLFFVIMRGNCDNKLQWPFNHRAKFLVIDQAAVDEVKYHWTVSCRSNSNSECFDQPVFSGMNVPFGIQKLIPLESVKRTPNRYVKNDTMYIRFSIDLTAAEDVQSMSNVQGEPPNDDEHVVLTEDDINSSICGEIYSIDGFICK